MSDYKDLDRLLGQFIKEGPAGCGCAIAKAGELLYEGYFGYADIEKKIPITRDTVYRQYSMTKIMIYTVCMMLYEKGYFLLDDPISEYFPEWRTMTKYSRLSDGKYQVLPLEQPVRIKHIMSMSCGLPYGHMPGDSPTSRDMFRITSELKERGAYTLREEIKAISKVPVEFEPGTRWLYGFGSELAAGLIEVVTGMEIEDALKKYIIEPLDMKSTGMRYFGDIQERLATLYQREEEGSLTPTPGMNEGTALPGEENRRGCPRLFSTVGDFIKFTQMLANGGRHGKECIIGRKTIDLMKTNQLNERQLLDFQNDYLAGYGYGLGVRTMMEPAKGLSNTPVGEFGWTGGAGTWASMDSTNGVSVVYMHQLMPNMEKHHHLRVRACAYGTLH